MSAIYRSTLVLFVALWFGLAGLAQAEILFTDNFNGADNLDGNYGLNDNLAARQAGSTLGTVNWGRFWKTEESYKDKVQVNNTTTTGYKADTLCLGESNVLTGWNNAVKHSAIIQHNFGAGATAAKIAAAGGFNVRFDIDPVYYSSVSGGAGYGAGVFIGAKDATESNVTGAPNPSPYAGRGDAEVDLSMQVLNYHDIGGQGPGAYYQAFKYKDITLSSGWQRFDPNAPAWPSTEKLYSFELRVTTDGFATADSASAELWWLNTNVSPNAWTQLDINGTAGGMAYTFNWNASDQCYIGFFEFQNTTGTPAPKSVSYIDNVSITCADVPEPGTLALLAAGLIGLSAYAWRKRK